MATGLKWTATMATKRSDTSASTRIVVPGAQSMVALLGSSDELLRLIERAFTCDIQPWRRPRGPALVELVKDYLGRAGITEQTGTEV